MVGTFVRPSRETERQYLIQELNLLRVYETTKGEDIEKLSYHSLLNLLAVKQAVRE